MITIILVTIIYNHHHNPFNYHNHYHNPCNYHNHPKCQTQVSRVSLCALLLLSRCQPGWLVNNFFAFTTIDQVLGKGRGVKIFGGLLLQISKCNFHLKSLKSYTIKLNYIIRSPLFRKGLGSRWLHPCLVQDPGNHNAWKVQCLVIIIMIDDADHYDDHDNYHNDDWWSRSWWW